MDQINVVRLKVLDWRATGLPKKLWPRSNDLVLTGKGSALHRLTWNGGGVEWSEETEAQLIRACQWVSVRIGEAC